MADQEDLMRMRPIGYLRSVFQYKNGTPRQPSLCSAARGSLTLDKTIFNNPEHSLEGLEHFSHAWIVFVFHKNRPGHSKAKVKPPRLDGKRVGVFSTRSPYRPNAIGLTLAKIERISGPTVHFSGVDIVDGTPVLDIKPFIPQYDAPVSRGETLTASAHRLEDGDGLRSVSAGLDNAEEEADVEVDSGILESSSSGDSIRQLKKQVEKDSGRSESLSFGDRSPVDNEVENESEKVVSLRCSAVSSVAESGVSEDTASEGKTENVLLQVAEELGSSHLNPMLLVPSSSSQANDGAVLTDSVRKGGQNSTMQSSTKTNEFVKSRDITSAPLSEAARGGVVSLTPECKTGVTLSEAAEENYSDASNSENVTMATDSSIAPWLSSPPTSKLTVSFTPTAESQLRHFVERNTTGSDPLYSLDFLSGEDEVRAALVSVLSEDPRSVYRRQKCGDSLYFFTVDQIHVTCWFEASRAEVLRLQPLALAEKLTKR